jgi:hypothetical protein
MFRRGVDATADSGRCDFQIKNVCADSRLRLFVVNRLLLKVVASVVSGNPLEILKYCLNLLGVSKAGIHSSYLCTVSTNKPSIDPVQHVVAKKVWDQDCSEYTRYGPFPQSLRLQ